MKPPKKSSYRPVSFTPGPWTTEEYKVISEPAAAVVATFDNYAGVILEEEVNANGALISAAPDLLAALLKVEEHFVLTGSTPVKLWKTVKAAILKAERRKS